MGLFVWCLAYGTFLVFSVLWNVIYQEDMLDGCMVQLVNTVCWGV